MTENTQVKRAPLTTYVTRENVEFLLGCCETKAYKFLREVNAYAVKQGKLGYGSGKANKYLFSELSGIPMSIIDDVIESQTPTKSKRGRKKKVVG